LEVSLECDNSWVCMFHEDTCYTSKSRFVIGALAAASRKALLTPLPIMRL